MPKSETAIWPRLALPAFFLFVMWAVELVETVLHTSFAALGILPREPERLFGVLTAPFIHGTWDHILSNSLPFAALSAILFLGFRRVSYPVFIYIYLITGLAVWGLARGGTFHIGASGLVYGLFGFVFFSGIFRGDIRSIGIALAVGFFYGGMVWGVMPNQPGISWESHLFGMVAGAVLAYRYRASGRERPPQWMEEEGDRRTFQDFIDKYGT